MLRLLARSALRAARLSRMLASGAVPSVGKVGIFARPVLPAARLSRTLASGAAPPKDMVAMLDTRGPSHVSRAEPLHEMGVVYAPGQPSPQECIDAIPVIPVEGHLAICDGGGGALGHPIEYIQLNTRHHDPATCKYCGLRFVSVGGGHGH